MLPNLIPQRRHNRTLTQTQPNQPTFKRDKATAGVVWRRVVSDQNRLGFFVVWLEIFRIIVRFFVVWLELIVQLVAFDGERGDVGHLVE